jgi:hypothetical protein
MSIPNFLINSYIKDCNNNCELFCKNIFKEGIMTKQLEEENLVLIYNKFDDHHMSELKRECRSLILDKNTLEIKAYSCETPHLVQNKDLLLKENNIINMCYEGTLLSIFNHNNKWYVSTRRCLNSSNSIFNTGENVLKSHYQMFEEVLLKTEYNNFENFSKCLDSTKSYYFVLIHHENKHIIDYSYKFDFNYCKLCLISIRDNNMFELDIYDKSLSFVCDNIFLPERFDSIDEFIRINELNKYDGNVKDEGIIIKVLIPETNKYSLYKLQTDSYKLQIVIGNDKNMYKGLIHLYQNNKITEYFLQNPNSNFIKIVNPLNTYESFYSTGIIDSIFKVFTSEIFELFKLICSLKTGKCQNKELYEILPKEYKNIIYDIRGIYFKKKAKLFENTNEKTGEELRKSHLTINDIYNHLKNIHVDRIVNFLKARKLMNNWINFDKTNSLLVEFSKISSLCNKVHIKQTSILTNKLFPEITFSDFPETKKVK